ncbi:hypothetical protein [Flavicella sediminum]|uniref:hypothetical protein n=1 Tax=Flavicella sediminum TaxID=2585141 RepID=UPI00111DF581|nr:hypothetical protein [Flavicella sediminum]
MLSVVGKVLKKELKNKSAEIIIDEQNGNQICFQVRSKEVIKLVTIDTSQIVRVYYQTDLSEVVKKEGVSRINNLILKEITPLGF